MLPTLCVGATMAYAIRSTNYKLVKLVCVVFPLFRRPERCHISFLLLQNSKEFRVLSY